MIKHIQHKRQEGFTLLELLLVLAVGALVIAGAVLIYNTVAVSRGATATVQLVSSMRSEVAATYGTQQNYTGIGIGFLQTAGVVNAGATNPFGGNVAIAAVGTTQYTITLGAVPDSACVKVGAAINDAGVANLDVAGGAPGQVANLITALVANCVSPSGNMVYTFNY